MIPIRLCTIGVYGFDEESFYTRLQEARVDTLIDIRRRRGVRGSQYAFANSRRLQDGLLTRGVDYLHALELAPSLALIRAQDEEDKATLGSRRFRTRLSAQFKDRYARECLAGFDTEAFLVEHALKGKTIAFLCVEGEPNACHRSLVADYVRADTGAEIVHLRP